MSVSFNRYVITILVAFFAMAGLVAAQQTSDATPAQRISVMSDRLDRMKRSLNSGISVLREENKSDSSKKDDEKNIATPLGRLAALLKDVNRVSGDVGNI